MKLLPLIITSSSATLPLVNAGWTEVEDVLLKMETVVRGLRDELENAYAARCDSTTLETCTKNNYHDCASMFPSPQCGLIFDDKDPHSLCQCGLIWDTTTTTVTMPNTLLGKNFTPRDDKLIETACYSRLAENYIINSFHDTYWKENNVQLGSIFFGATDGIFRRIPARQTEECGWYDPRVRPWYNAASSVPKDVLLVIDRSQSMNGDPLVMAKVAAITIIDTLTASDTVTIISFSSEAEILLEGNVYIEGTDSNKAQLVNAIDSLESANGTSHLFNAFNLTFDILGNSSTSGNPRRCNTAIVLLTNGRVEEGKSENETSKVIDFVQEQIEGLSINESKNSILFTFSVGNDADTGLTKRIACSTGGVWRHLGDVELIDLVSAMSSYYKLFSMGLADNDHSDFVSWIKPYFWVLDGRWATSVGVPVFDREVTPYQLLGVAGVGIYMDSLKRIHGENTTDLLFQKWIMNRTRIESCLAVIPTDCQLETYRFLGGGENSTCGICNKTAYNISIAPEKCPSNNSLSVSVWNNIQVDEKDYTERGCCENVNSVSSESCPSPESPASGGCSAKWGVIAASISVASALFNC